MRIQKKDNSVECIICEDELQEKYHITMEDIARCSEKTSELMQDICEKTQAFLSVEPPDYIRLGVKIDAENKCVVVVGTSANTENTLPFEPSLHEETPEEDIATEPVQYGPKGYVFESMRDIMEVCCVLPKDQISSCLIKCRDYILVLDDVPEELAQKVAFCMCEFAKETLFYDSMDAVRTGDVLISLGAIEKLANR